LYFINAGGKKMTITELDGRGHVWQVTPPDMQIGRDYHFAALLSAHGCKELKAFKARVAEIKKRRAQERLANAG
jgi:hypothetical protein